MRVLLLYPEFPDTFWSFKHALRFVRKKASSPPLGLITVAALLPSTWEKRLVDVNVARLRDRDVAWADIVMISAMIVQRESAHALIARCKKAGKTVIAGGPLFLSEYEAFPEVDHFILNEGEITLPLFLSDLALGCPQRIYKTSEFAEMS
ncbi:MAG TPA: cobalamin-dependent protein, partial [bacterium]|nr:cobalamin-dependent protein [bacterium]